MADDDSPKKTNISLRFAIMTAAIVAVCVGWVVGWRMLSDGFAQTLDQTLFNTQTGGVFCDGRQRGGFPFRLTQTCEAITARVAGPMGVAHASVDGVRVTTLPYQLDRTIFELNGPFEFNPPQHDATTVVDWTQARASLRHDFEILTRFDAEMTDARLADPAMGHWRAVDTQLHMRKTPEAELAADVSFRVTALHREGIDEAKAIDAIVTVRLDPAQTVLWGVPGMLAREWRQAGGGDLVVQDLQVVVGDGRLKASGRFTVDGQGYPSGTLRLELTDPDALVNELAVYLPDQQFSSEAMSGAVKAVAIAHPDTTEDVKVLDVKVDAGSMSLGLLPLGKLPPLFAVLP